MTLRRRLAAFGGCALMAASLTIVAPARAQEDENRPPSGSMEVRLTPPDTVFTVDATDPEDGFLLFEWTADIECGRFRANFPEEYQATWSHPAGEPPDGCPHEEGTNHTGVVSVIVTDDGGGSIQCVHEGSGDGNHDCNIYGEDLDDCTIDMRIHDGLGGALPADEDETTRGAFTVVNSNDTDNLGGRDLSQNAVEGERDLMRVVLKKPQPSAGGIVTFYWPATQAKVWRRSTKTRQLVGDGSFDFPVSALPKTVWVEATQPSAAVRDMTFEASYRPTGGNEACFDEARATFIRVELVEARHDATDQIWADMPAQPRTGLERNCGGLGLRPPGPKPRGIRNCIGFRFQIAPPGVWNEPGILFDITRQKAGTARVDFRDPDMADPPEQKSWFPRRSRNEPAEEPNDDSHDRDESQQPDGNGIMFSYDGPGTPDNESGGPPRTRFFYEAHFREFVRVRFDGVRPTGNKEVGTRASQFVRWTAIHSLVTNRAGIWVRISGDNNETADNLVDLR